MGGAGGVSLFSTGCCKIFLCSMVIKRDEEIGVLFPWGEGLPAMQGQTANVGRSLQSLASGSRRSVAWKSFTTRNLFLGLESRLKGADVSPSPSHPLATMQQDVEAIVSAAKVSRTLASFYVRYVRFYFGTGVGTWGRHVAALFHPVPGIPVL